MPVIGGSFKKISSSDIKTRKTTLNQLVDIIQEDISGSTTRRSYQVFVTGGVGPGVTSSLYQSVYDQNFTLQTSNPLFDVAYGVNESSTDVANATSEPADANGKKTFPSSSLMMREKIDVYRQHAAWLLGNASSQFSSPFGAASATNIDHALFLNMKRLFTRDGIKQNTFAVKLNRSGSNSKDKNSAGVSGQANLYLTSISGSTVFVDSPSNTTDYTGAKVGNIKNSANASEVACGLIFYDKGAVVLDMAKVFSGSQHMSGTLQAMANASTLGGDTIPAGSTVLGSSAAGKSSNGQAKLIPDFVVSGSIDAILNHVMSTRFQSGTLTAMTFQNKTNINSTLIFCRATADEFNYSSNPTFTDPTSGKIVVIDENQEDIQRSFTFPTTVGLHDQFGNTLAVAKFSRPIEKNDEKDITFRIRLDF